MPWVNFHRSPLHAMVRYSRSFCTDCRGLVQRPVASRWWIAQDFNSSLHMLALPNNFKVTIVITCRVDVNPKSPQRAIFSIRCYWAMKCSADHPKKASQALHLLMISFETYSVEPVFLYKCSLENSDSWVSSNQANPTQRPSTNFF